MHAAVSGGVQVCWFTGLVALAAGPDIQLRRTASILTSVAGYHRQLQLHLAFAGLLLQPMPLGLAMLLIW
jgi:hypothetical protein